MKKFRFQWGAFLMFIIYGGLFFLLFGRFLFIQITGEAEGKALAAMAEAKYARESILPANRGDILDRNGEVIASDTVSYRLVAVLDESLSKNTKVPHHVNEPERAAAVLAEHLPLEEKELLERLTRTEEDVKELRKKQVEFGKAGRDISRDAVLAIQEEELHGILFLEESKRFYPNGIFASHLIGFAAREEEEDGKITTVGKMGLESIYNKELTGIPGKVEFQSDKWGFTLPKTEKAVVPAEDGYNIQLTIDQTIQNFVDDAMSAVEKEYAPEKMLAVVADPKTGAIVAMGQRPTFDPTTREGLTSNWLNEAIENTIEPGSTMKMFTLAAAIEEGKWQPNDYFQSGQYKLYDQTIRDHNRTGWGTISFLEGFQRSSNVSMAYLLERIGNKEFIEYIEQFGFGEKTGIDLPNEASGVVLNKYPSERLTTAYGQGSTVTPMQMIQAATAIANDGVMMKPYVIDEIVNPNTEEIVKKGKPEERKSPISKATAKQVRELLASTVTADVGTGRRFALDGYTMGGKTGTAEIPNGYGGYFGGNGQYLYSFLGMAPIEDPQLITYIYVQKPKLKAGETGSDPVAKLFKTIMESSLKYMNIVPAGEPLIEAPTIDDYTGQDAVESKAALKKLNYHPVIIGEGGKIDLQYPEKGTKLGHDSVVLLKTAGQTTLPDFTGWSKKMILSFKMLSGLDIRIVGDGYVTEQSLSVGTLTNTNDPIVIQLQHPSETHKYVEPSEDAEESIVGG